MFYTKAGFGPWLCAFWFSFFAASWFSGDNEADQEKATRVEN